ncbi:MAG: ATP-binding protein [Betaproteobacteria bacterium]
MMNYYEQLERSLQRFALGLSLLLALTIPLGYWLVSYFDYADSLDFKAKVKAATLSETIASNPDTWMYAENRMQGLIAHEPVLLKTEIVQVIDQSHSVVLHVGDNPLRPVLTRSYALYDGGREVGKIAVTGSLRSMLWKTLASALIGLLFGAMAYVVIKLIPLRALKAATLALSASEARFRNLFENIPNVAVQGYDAARRVIAWNAASERLYGYTAAEATGQDMLDLIVPEALRRNVFFAVSAWMGGGPVLPSGESLMQRKDGTTVSVFSSYTLLADASGRPEMYRVDVELTELKRTEAELRKYQAHLEDMVSERTLALSIAKEAAESASRAKSIFLSTMSHELRTPMNGIMGMTELARSRAKDPQQIEFLNQSLASSRHLLELINSILDISQIEADRLTLEERNFSLAQVIFESLGACDSMAQEKGLRLSAEIEPAPQLPDLLCGDAMRLKQIVLNFIGNAIKFSDHGQIILRACAVEKFTDALLLRIEVEDQGIGLSKEQQKIVFNAFTQVDGSSTRKYGGAGLGLSICRRLARLMGGDAGVISQVGVGSTFWVTARLRLAVDAPQPEKHAQAESPTERLARFYSGIRVLVAEDDPVSQEVTRMVLEEAGLLVEVAHNGLVAIDMARNGGYDLILMDMQMPVMGGLEATRAIRQLPGMSDVPILAVTANAFNVDRDICLAAGMNAHIGKPVTADVLCSTVLHLLQKMKHKTPI